MPAQAGGAQLCSPSGMWKTTSGMKAEAVFPAGSAGRGGKAGVVGGTPKIWNCLLNGARLPTCSAKRRRI